MGDRVEKFRGETRSLTAKWEEKIGRGVLDSLSAELQQFLPTPDTQQNLKERTSRVLERLRSCLKSYIDRVRAGKKAGPGKSKGNSDKKLMKLEDWKLCDFGSSAMGIMDRGGDLDISLEGSLGGVMLSELEKVDKVGLLGTIRMVFQRGGICEDGQVIGSAKFPVLKFVDEESGTKCDLLIGNSSAWLKSHLLKLVLDMDVRVKHLIVLAKKWARHYGINDASHGSLSSYCIMVLVITFCQQCSPPVLPAFKDLFPRLRNDMERRKAGMSYQALTSLLEKHSKAPANWVEQNRGTESENKEALFSLLGKWFITIREFIKWTKQINPNGNEKLSASSWEGTFCLLPWEEQAKKSYKLFVRDILATVASDLNVARALKGESLLNAVAIQGRPFADVTTAFGYAANNLLKISTTPSDTGVRKQCIAAMFITRAPSKPQVPQGGKKHYWKRRKKVSKPRAVQSIEARIANAIAVAPGEPILMICMKADKLTKQFVENGARITLLEAISTSQKALKEQFGDKVCRLDGGWKTADYNTIAEDMIRSNPDGSKRKVQVVVNIPQKFATQCLQQLLLATSFSNILIVLEEALARHLTSSGGHDVNAHRLIKGMTLIASEPVHKFKVPQSITGYGERCKLALVEFVVKQEATRSLIDLVQKAFSEPKKPLTNSLKSLHSHEAVVEALGKCGVSKGASAKNLSIDQFAIFHKHLQGPIPGRSPQS